ncbi:hypothetical protein [Dactylosporangium sp. NPDC048998]|uniref:hypothetical protein n=1 Tax=Dactylosporangium sp. NPDC048998 TaxID=3363976 RepID=UPI00371BCBF3
MLGDGVAEGSVEGVVVGLVDGPVDGAVEGPVDGVGDGVVESGPDAATDPVHAVYATEQPALEADADIATAPTASRPLAMATAAVASRIRGPVETCIFGSFR